MMKLLGLLIVVLVAITAGCAQTRDDDYFRVSSSEPRLRGDGEEYLPPSIGDWNRDGEVREYTTAQLSNLVGDDESLFRAYGARKAWSADYPGPDGRNQVKAHLFVMRSPIDAFGIFSRYRTPESAAFQVGSEGFREDNLVAFYHKHFFMKLIADDGADYESLKELAEMFSIHIMAGDEPERPRELRLLSDKGIQRGTETYFASSVLGHNYLPKGLMAKYIYDGEEVTTYLVVFDSMEAAESAFNRGRSEWHGDRQYMELHEVYAPWGEFEEIIAIGHPATGWTAFSYIDRFMVITRGEREAAIGQTSHLWLYLIYAVED